MAIDSSIIGKSSSPQRFLITRAAVQRFMEATEDPALHNNRPIEYAPPTFPTTFRAHIPLHQLDNSKVQLVHGEQIYNYRRRLRIGEEITCVSSIIDIRRREGRSGPMTILISETTGTDSAQQIVYTARSLLLVRAK